MISLTVCSIGRTLERIKVEENGLIVASLTENHPGEFAVFPARTVAGQRFIKNNKDSIVGVFTKDDDLAAIRSTLRKITKEVGGL